MLTPVLALFRPTVAHSHPGWPEARHLANAPAEACQRAARRGASGKLVRYRRGAVTFARIATIR
jgi:hypothetical protein